LVLVQIWYKRLGLCSELFSKKLCVGTWYEVHRLVFCIFGVPIFNLIRTILKKIRFLFR
jgi:hypothetical protein